MDKDFLAKLDDHISNIGRQECWKKEIGDHIVWLSPISYAAQTKVTETLSNESLGNSVIAETKRVTLSYSVVGIDDVDLRPFRDQGEVFVIPDPRKPNGTIKVDLPKYLYIKMADWGIDWMDTTFDIFVDLMQSFEKKNKSKIKFENAKDPYEELMELETRAMALREKLKLPPMVEKPAGDNTSQVTEKSSDEVKDEQPAQVAFDPFKRLPDQTEGQESISQETPDGTAVKEEPVERPEDSALKLSQSETQPPDIPSPVPVTTIPFPDPKKMTPIEAALAQRSQARATILDSSKPLSSPDRPLQALPSVSPDVVEEQAAGRPPVAPPRINKTHTNQSQNPRFSKPIR